MITKINKVRQTFLSGWKKTSVNNKTFKELVCKNSCCIFDFTIDDLIDRGEVKIIDIYYKHLHNNLLFGDCEEIELGVENDHERFEFIIYLNFPKNNKVFALSLETQGWRICDNNLKKLIRRKVLYKLLLEFINEDNGFKEDNIFVNDKFDKERQTKEETFLEFSGYRAL